MPLVNAESDESFVAEVADEVRASCTRTNDHICTMIEEYLRRRVDKVRCEMEKVCNARIEQMKQELVTIEGERAAEQTRHASVSKQLADAAEALQHKDAKMHLLRCFLCWKNGSERCRERRCLGEEASRHHSRLAAFHAYSQWRLFAAARRSAHLEATELKKRDCREQELLDQIRAQKKLLVEEQEKNDALNEKLKEAFMRGMCALNHEAVQVLHGTDAKQDDSDAEAIAEILSRDSYSRKLSPPQGKKAVSTLFNTQDHSICPVHQVGCDGHFYHRCYAPGYCVYGEHRPRSRTPPSSSTSVSIAPRSPFVVRADPRAVRSVNSGSSVPLRHASKPSQMRWKL